MGRFFWQNKPWQAFKNFAIIFSFVVNFILILVLGVVAILLFPFLSNMVTPLVGGLDESFAEMNEASIVQSIAVDDTMPISFDLPLDQSTDVILSQDVALNVPATFTLPAGGGTINGRVDITLPAGQVLPVNLSMIVPVSQTIPVALDVPVEIPLDKTELATPFARLVELFGPLTGFLEGLPEDNDEFMSRVNAAIRGDQTASDKPTTTAKTNE